MVTITQPCTGQPYAIVLADSGESLLSMDESTVIDLYKQHGAILFRGFNVDLEAFQGLTSTYCIGAAFNDSPGRGMLDEITNIQTVDPGPQAFPLHPEISREPWRPDVCFFGCMGPPTKGGETIICDGIEIVDNMGQELFNAFASRRLRYTLVASTEFCEYWLGSSDPDATILDNPPENCPYTFIRHEGIIYHTFTEPALYAPMFSSKLAFGNFLLFARHRLKKDIFPVFANLEKVSDELLDAVKVVSDRVSVAINWQKGDAVMLDNTRFMHGRNAILDLDERLIMTYFGYLKFAKPGVEEPVNAPWRKPGFRPPPTPYEPPA